MKITIRPDPDCIELIRSEFTDIALSFLKSLGVPEKEADNWESTHLVEIIENLPTMFVIFEMRCFLPEILYEKSEWVFKIAKNNLFNSFIIVDQVVCCRLLNTGGLKQLPENLLNLNCNNYKDKRFNDDFNELKNLHALRSISFQE